MAEMNLDDDAEFLRRRPKAASLYRPRPPPPPPQDRTPGFFGLPAELRAQIYDLVFDAARVDPPVAPFLGDHQNTQGEIRYPAHYRPWRWPSTYWVSKLFRSQMIEHADDRLLKRKIPAELDIMVNGFVFFPTWLYLPPDIPSDPPFDLDVSLRIFSGEAFRSNDGWPRQPGSGFRNLLKLLRELVHEGPSFGQKFELLSGIGKWNINTLRVNVSFHDKYTPATIPETSHEIFGRLKALALSGLARNIVKTISAHSEYSLPNSSEKVTWDRTWPVAQRPNNTEAQQWRSMGFLNTQQRTLADDYRPPWDSSSGGPSRRTQKLISPLERRDSPVGIIAPVAENPQMDDYGLITPPTPRASVGIDGTTNGVGKRRSTPVPPPPASAASSSTAATTNGCAGASAGAIANGLLDLDDYSAVMTPRMNEMLDDYSIVMTPQRSGSVEGEDGYS